LRKLFQKFHSFKRFSNFFSFFERVMGYPAKMVPELKSAALGNVKIALSRSVLMAEIGFITRAASSLTIPLFGGVSCGVSVWFSIFNLLNMG
jgi:hypothetical protein